MGAPGSDDAEGTKMGEIPARNAFSVLTRQEAILILRYIPAKVVLHRLRPVFLAKYILVVIIGVLLALRTLYWVVGALVLVFLSAALIQLVLTRTIRGLGALRQLAAFDEHVQDIVTTWWPAFRDELARLGEIQSPWGLLKLSAKAAARKQAMDDTLLAAIDWEVIIPVDRWVRARTALAQAAGATL